MTEQQMFQWFAALAMHVKRFLILSKEAAQWAIQNPKEAIGVMVKALEEYYKETYRLLEIGTTSIPAFESFVVREKFVYAGGDTAKVKFSLIDLLFLKEFGDITEISRPAVVLYRYKLKRGSSDRHIFAEMGGKNKAETFLSDLLYLLEKQKNGEAGNLLINGKVNIFYLKNGEGSLLPVYTRWDGVGWRLNVFVKYWNGVGWSVNPIDIPCEWSAGDQVLSHNVLKSSVTLSV